MQQNKYAKALAAAFPFTVPILAGFLFLGIAYGIFMDVSGFPALYPFLMSLTIFAGSMEFVTVDLLGAAFHPLGAFFMALLVNARHLFYGISMLDRFKGTGRKKFYLIFSMCDESFSINCTARVPLGVDAGWFMFFVTLLNHCYWVAGATLGGLLGGLIQFNTEGLDFVMVALFIVLFLEQWKKERNHFSALLGIAASLACLLVFGADQFILPAMAVIFAVLALLRSRLEKDGVPA